MRSLTPKVDRYKRGIIRSFAPMLAKGLVTPLEIEFIANGAVTEALTNERTRKLFTEDR